MPSQQTVYRPATLIGAPASRQGKTLLSAGLARRFCNQGKKVAIFKIGPDYLDPTILEVASGQPVFNLDLWMMGETHCRQLLGQGAAENDVVLVESMMGLHDNVPSSAELAKLLELPVTLVINVAKFAQTAAALVYGLESYGCEPRIRQIIGNCVGSNNHDRLMREAMGECYAGSVRRDERFSLPERHLGLVQGSELTDLDSRLDEIALLLDEFEINLDLEIVEFPYHSQLSEPQKLLQGRTVGVARDTAFCFIYPANLKFLEEQGAQVKYFSPLANEPVPQCDALWLPGGYPELYLESLSAADTTRNSIQELHRQGKPMLAECGGMMALCRNITSTQSKTFSGLEVLDADCQMHSRFQSVGLQSVDYGFGEIRGHSFHHSTLHLQQEPVWFATKQNGDKGEAVYRSANATLSYLHHYFPSNPEAAVKLFL